MKDHLNNSLNVTFYLRQEPIQDVEQAVFPAPCIWSVEDEEVCHEEVCLSVFMYSIWFKWEEALSIRRRVEKLDEAKNQLN